MDNSITFKEKLMGSPFSVRAYAGNGISREMAESTVRAAFHEAKRIEDLITDFRESPLENINAQAGLAPVIVPEELFGLVEFACGISEDSGGAFDITFASAGILWRKSFETGIPPSHKDLEEAKRHIGFRKLMLDRKKLEIFLPEKGMRISLAAIGKGYAVDRMHELLERCGIRNFFINGAGDIRGRASGEAPRPWRIGIRNPFSKKDIPAGALTLSNGAVATSGDYERFFTYRGRKYHHIMDARTSEIRDGTASVTVLAKTALLADTYATTAMALGMKEGLEFLSRQRNAGGFLISSEGKVSECNIKNTTLAHSAAAHLIGG